MALGQAGQGPRSKKEQEPTKAEYLCTSLNEENTVFLSCGCQQEPGVFNLDEAALKHMMSPLAKRKRQLQMSSKCRIEACTNVPSLAVIILGNCKES